MQCEQTDTHDFLQLFGDLNFVQLISQKSTITRPLKQYIQQPQKLITQLLIAQKRYIKNYNIITRAFSRTSMVWLFIVSQLADKGNILKIKILGRRPWTRVRIFVCIELVMIYKHHIHPHSRLVQQAGIFLCLISFKVFIFVHFFFSPNDCT